MYSKKEFNYLTSIYGPFASWAIWNSQKESDTSVIYQNIDKLHSKYILLGLNASGSLLNKAWTNFHSGRHDRKLKYACNNSKLRGSYITDIFKDIQEPIATKVIINLTNKTIKKNVNLFNLEMRDIKINKKSQFIVFGSLAAQYFNNYFKQNYKNHIIYYRHYSDFSLKDKEWVNGFWVKVGVNQNYDLMLKKYKKP